MVVHAHAFTHTSNPALNLTVLISNKHARGHLTVPESNRELSPRDTSRTCIYLSNVHCSKYAIIKPSQRLSANHDPSRWTGLHRFEPRVFDGAHRVVVIDDYDDDSKGCSAEVPSALCPHSAVSEWTPKAPSPAKEDDLDSMAVRARTDNDGVSDRDQLKDNDDDSVILDGQVESGRSVSSRKTSSQVDEAHALQTHTDGCDVSDEVCASSSSPLTSPALSDDDDGVAHEEMML